MTWTTDGRWAKELQAQRDKAKAQAAQLAEALREVVATGHDHSETGGVLITHEAWQASMQALAAYEEGK